MNVKFFTVFILVLININCLFVQSISTTTTTTTISSIPVIEQQALNDFYNNANGDYWIWQNESISGLKWNLTDTEYFPCGKKFQGLSCTCNSNSEYCFISQIILNHYNMSGFISSNISNFLNLNVLNVGYNHLKGLIPSSLSNLKKLNQLILKYNSFSSTIPPGLINKYLITFDLSKNKLNGCLPLNFGLLYSLQSFNISYNKLSCDFSSIMFQSAYKLQSFDIHSNEMTGEFTFNATLQKLSKSLLQTIDVSSNYFTGVIPKNIFKLPFLASLSAGQNCIKGEISIDVCESKISSLMLDGLYTAKPCRINIFPGSSTYYSVASVISGGIPNCVYNMSNIKNLFLSGNGITGTLSTDIIISPTLQNLVLSYNHIHGVIPKYVSERSWQNLDLSNNKISGIIEENFHSVANGSKLALTSNRLSGEIPESLIDALDIDILSGNIFSCASFFKQAILPKYDEMNVKNNYTCGSYNFNLSLIVVFLIAVCQLMYLIYYGIRFKDKNFKPDNTKRLNDPNYLEKIGYKLAFCLLGQNFYSARDALRKSGQDLYADKISNITELCNNVEIFSSYLKNLFFFVLIFWLPIVTLINNSYGIYAHSYGWNISLLYVSGVFPFIFIAIIMIITTGLIFLYILKISKVKKKIYNKNEMVRITSKILVMSVVFIINCVVIGFLNYFYIKLSSEKNGYDQVVLEIAVSLFKFIWNFIAIEYCDCVKNFRNNLDGVRNDVVFKCYINMINFLFFPFLATTILDRNCFYNAFFQSDSCVTNYSTSICNEFDEIKGCQSYSIISQDYSFYPPFQYTYYCTSTLMNIYTPIYMFSALIMMFQMPIYRLLCKIMYSFLYIIGKIIDKDIIPTNVKPFSVQLSDETSYDSNFELFFSSPFVVNSICYIVLLLTLGVIVPALGLLIIICLLLYFHFTLSELGKYLINARKESDVKYRHVLGIIERNCDGIPRAINVSIFVCVPSMVVFYTFYLFDVLGDVTNNHTSYLVLVIGLMLLVFYIFFASTICKYIYFCIYNENFYDTDTNDSNRNSCYIFDENKIKTSLLPNNNYSINYPNDSQNPLRKLSVGEWNL